MVRARRRRALNDEGQFVRSKADAIARDLTRAASLSAEVVIRAPDGPRKEKMQQLLQCPRAVSEAVQFVVGDN